MAGSQACLFCWCSLCPAVSPQLHSLKNWGFSLAVVELLMKLLVSQQWDWDVHRSPETLPLFSSPPELGVLARP